MCHRDGFIVTALYQKFYVLVLGQSKSSQFVNSSTTKDYYSNGSLNLIWQVVLKFCDTLGQNANYHPR